MKIGDTVEFHNPLSFLGERVEGKIIGIGDYRYLVEFEGRKIELIDYEIFSVTPAQDGTDKSKTKV